MTRTRHTALGFLFFTLAMLTGVRPAQAAWLGLADGSYVVTLTSCTSSLPGLCATFPVLGQITVGGSGLSALSITIDGRSFADDPIDFVQDPFITAGDVRQRSTVTNGSPFAFISLLHEIGTLGPVLPFTNAYIYCRPTNNDACAPDTAGEWTATPLAVPEPTTFALASLVAASLGLRRRRGERR